MAGIFRNPFGLEHPCVSHNTSLQALMNDENKFLESLISENPLGKNIRSNDQLTERLHGLMMNYTPNEESFTSDQSLMRVASWNNIKTLFLVGITEYLTIKLQMVWEIHHILT